MIQKSQTLAAGDRVRILSGPYADRFGTIAVTNTRASVQAVDLDKPIERRTLNGVEVDTRVMAWTRWLQRVEAT